jgi:plastocyanin
MKEVGMQKTFSLILVAGLFFLLLFAGHSNGMAQEKGNNQLDTHVAIQHDTVFVNMVNDPNSGSYQFQPDSVFVKQGNVVRFTNESDALHNIEFRQIRRGAKIGSARSGPYLTAEGQTYDVVIGEGFVPGEYKYVCLPHDAMMPAGHIIVQ